MLYQSQNSIMKQEEEEEEVIVVFPWTIFN